MKKIFFYTACLLAVSSHSIAHASISEVDALRDQYLDIVNEYRISKNLKPLEPLSVIEEVAFKHSHSMATGKRKFGHIGFSNRCSEIKEDVGKGNLCGEIVAWGQKSPRKVFNAWMNSPGHRDKIDQRRFTHTGLGFHKNSEGIIYWTQIFLEIN